MYAWLNVSFREGMFSEADEQPVFRRDGVLKSALEVGGSVNKFNYFIGRPRIRQIRSKPCNEDSRLELHDSFSESPIHNATCFDWQDGDTPDKAPFFTGDRECVPCSPSWLCQRLHPCCGHSRWKFKDADVTDYP